jgi:hypothetical protein
VSRGQRGGSPTVVNLSFLDRLHPQSKLNYPIVLKFNRGYENDSKATMHMADNH